MRPTTAYLLEQAERSFRVQRLWESAISDSPDNYPVASRAEVLITDSSIGASAELIDRLPQLKLISIFGVGYDTVDVECANRRGVAVTNTPGVLTEDVADLALALIITTHRKMLAADKHVRAGRWVDGPFELGHRFSTRPVGIVGLGLIGRAVATRVTACGAKVYYHGRTHQSGQPYRYFAGLTELARAVGTLVVCVPETMETRGLIGREVLEALGSDGVLINVARGAVVAEDVLIEMLSTRRLRGAGLDVFEREPVVPNELSCLDNVVLQPHQGSGTHETRQAMADLVLANVARHFAGQELLTRCG